MMCKAPYRKGPQQYGCGQCLPCRINKIRIWQARMMIEAAEWHDRGLPSAFLTLTYRPEDLPPDASVSKDEIQRFMKRLRKYSGRTFRYYAVGEYGEKNWRPHYHLIVFGLSPTEQELVQKCWPFGFIKLGTVQSSSVRYTAGYLMKGATKATDPRLAGRTPEFALMSSRPALGIGIVDRISKSLSTSQGLAAFEKLSWIPQEIRMEGQVYPLARILKDKIEKTLGLDRIDKALYNARKFEEAYQKQKGEPYELRLEKWKARLGQQGGRLKIHRREL